MNENEIKEKMDNCKECKKSLKEKETYCERHCVLLHIDSLIISGTRLQDRYPIKNKFRAIEDFTKAVALGIEYLVSKD